MHKISEEFIGAYVFLFFLNQGRYVPHSTTSLQLPKYAITVHLYDSNRTNRFSANVIDPASVSRNDGKKDHVSPICQGQSVGKENSIICLSYP